MHVSDWYVDAKCDCEENEECCPSDDIILYAIIEVLIILSVSFVLLYLSWLFDTPSVNTEELEEQKEIVVEYDFV